MVWRASQRPGGYQGHSEFTGKFDVFGCFVTFKGHLEESELASGVYIYICVYIDIIYIIHLFTGATEDLFCQEELKKLLEAAPCSTGR